MKVGVTFFVRNHPRSIWECGVDQNCVFLAKLLERVDGVEHVYMVNGGDGETPSDGLMLGPLGLDFVRFDDVKDELDLLIMCGAQIDPPQEQYLHKRGAKVVAYKCGNEAIIDADRIINRKPAGGLVTGTQYDAIWSTPQHMHTCRAYWETVYRAPVRPVPHIWDPTFVDMAVSEFKPGVKWGYQPSTEKRIGIYEPNVQLLKTCITPLLVCENAFRARPDLIDYIHSCCSEGLTGQRTFEHLMLSLDIVRHKKVSFVGRYAFPWFQAAHADVVVSHQWECGLNYAYYEALYGHYPIVHNSELLEAGYRYDGFDAQDGGRVLVDVLEHHDVNTDNYNAAADAVVRAVSTMNPENITAHREAIDSLNSRRAAA
jgi:hypothetical protein